MSSNRFHIFPSILKVLGHSPINFIVIRFINKLLKFTQELPNDKRKIYNSKTIHAMTLKFLPELLLSKNSLPTKFIIFGAQKLKIKFKQVCMHLKTHFKFLFNSSKISTTCAHVLFFLNTTLHCDSTKFASLHLDLPLRRCKIHKIA